MKNQKGFSGIEALLIIVIIGLIGGVGWYVWNAKKESDKSLNQASQTDITAAAKKKETTKVEEDPTKGWKSYSSADGQYSLKYPNNWVQPERTDICSEGLLLLGSSTRYVGSCGSDNVGQISVYSVEGDKRSDYRLKKADYPDLNNETIKVSGVDGEKQTGTLKVESEGIGPANNSKTTVYLFYANNRTYVATYILQPDFPDITNDFNLMVTKTFKFSS